MPTNKKVNWKVLVLSFLVVFLVASIGSVFTLGDVKSQWYADNKPSFTPPDWLFGPVWTILYILIAFSIYISWTSSKSVKQKKKLAWLFGINLVANTLWTIFFFKLRNPTLAFVDILVILGTIIWLMIFTSKINRKAMWLLVPYLIWVCFASILNLGFIF